MADPNLQVKSKIAEYIKNDVVPKIPSEIEQFIPENVDGLINSLYALRYYCSQKNIDSNIVGRFDNIIETCQGLWELLELNTSTFMYLKEMYRVRKLDLISMLIGQYEEITSGEESFRDFILSSIATYIGWRSDNIWVDLGRIDQYKLSKSHFRRLRGELWRLLDDMPKNGDQTDLTKAVDIGEKMDMFLNVIISDETPPPGRALLLSAIYVLILRLTIDRTITIIQSIGDSENQ